MYDCYVVLCFTRGCVFYGVLSICLERCVFEFPRVVGAVLVVVVGFRKDCLSYLSFSVCWFGEFICVLYVLSSFYGFPVVDFKAC